MTRKAEIKQMLAVCEFTLKLRHVLSDADSSAAAAAKETATQQHDYTLSMEMLAYITKHDVTYTRIYKSVFLYLA